MMMNILFWIGLALFLIFNLGLVFILLCVLVVVAQSFFKDNNPQTKEEWKIT